jgi:hypothetical protein
MLFAPDNAGNMVMNEAISNKKTAPSFFVLCLTISGSSELPFFMFMEA